MSARKAPLPVPPAGEYAATFARMPVDNPYKHDFDPLDVAFACLAPGYYPDTSNPVDFARSDSEGFVTPVVWDDAPVCEPEFPAARRVEDVQTGRAL